MRKTSILTASIEKEIELCFAQNVYKYFHPIVHTAVAVAHIVCMYALLSFPGSSLRHRGEPGDKVRYYAILSKNLHVCQIYGTCNAALLVTYGQLYTGS